MCDYSLEIYRSRPAVQGERTSRSIHELTFPAASQRHHFAKQGRLALFASQVNGRRRASGDLVAVVHQHLAEFADIECLAAEGTALEVGASADAGEIAFPPSPYHAPARHCSAAFTVAPEACRLAESPLLAHDDRAPAPSLWRPHHRIESACGSPNRNGNRCHWHPRPPRVGRHRWLKPKHIGCGCHLARRFLRWRTCRTGTAFPSDGAGGSCGLRPGRQQHLRGEASQ